MAMRNHQAHNEHDKPDDEATIHRGNLADPRDIDHQAMAPDDHGARGGHEGHDKHAGHDPESFRQKFWLSLVLTIPVVLYSEMVQEWLRFSMPEFTGSNWIAPVLGTFIFFYGG